MFKEILNMDNSSKETKFGKFFYYNSTFDGSFNDTACVFIMSNLTSGQN